MTNAPELPYGTRVPAGLHGRHSTVIAEWDVETYSPAGFVWNAEKQGWDNLPGAGAKEKGLPTVGTAVYTAHPDAELLTLSYDLKDGRGIRRWKPGQPQPLDLFQHIADGKLIEAHNRGFEAMVNRNILAPKYGFPIVPLRQMRCSAAKARAFALPGGLADAGAALNLDVQKDKRGKELIKRFCVPRKPTKADARTRILMDGDPDGELFEQYCDTDVATEAELSRRVPDLPPDELEYWFCDQAINDRGVHVDREGVYACIDVIEQCHAEYSKELPALTNGYIQTSGQVARIIEWCHDQGAWIESLDSDEVERWLARIDDEPNVRDRDRVKRVLQIRAILGSASVKKVFAMSHQMTTEDRLHGLFTFHGARTGRPTGNGPQPQNLPNSGPMVHHCAACGHYFPAGPRCTACFELRGPSEPSEWSIEAAEDALDTIKSRSLGLVQMRWGDAMATLAGCLRPLFSAAPGYDLICSDYSAIEAVVLAELAGESWRQEVFHTHGKIYEASAAQTFGVPLDEILDYKKRTGNHHPLRKKGKVTELACFGADTLVLTDNGYKRIVDVAPHDKLWDGIEWTTHSGVISRGSRDVLVLDGIEVTPEHKMLCGRSWREARLLASSASALSRALATGSASLPFSASKSDAKRTTRNAGVPAVQPAVSSSATCIKALPLAAVSAPVSRRPLRAAVSLPQRSTPPRSAASTLGFTQRSADVTTPRVGASRTMAAGASRFTRHGAKIAAAFSNTWSRLMAGMRRGWTWIVSTTTGDTNRATCASSPGTTTWTTDEPPEAKSKSSPSCVPVFDILNAGSRNRFTIKTDSGHLVVHNCGYLGWIGAMRAMGYAGTDAEAKELVMGWRNASPSIVYLGGGQFEDQFARVKREQMYGMEGMAVSAVREPGKLFPVLRRDGTPSGLAWEVWNDVLYMHLPDGTSTIPYHQPRLTPPSSPWRGQGVEYSGYNTNAKKGPRGWIRMELYAGIMLENATQAVANRIQRHGMILLERSGYPVVQHVYDENVSEVPHGFGSIEEFERLMNTMPTWARDNAGRSWPIVARGGWRGERYRK